MWSLLLNNFCFHYMHMAGYWQYICFLNQSFVFFKFWLVEILPRLPKLTKLPKCASWDGSIIVMIRFLLDPMTLRQGPQKLASDHGMFPTRIFPFFMTSAFYNSPLPPEVWVGWPYLKNESTLFQKWSGQSELVGRKWQDIFIYCDIFHNWYILTRAEWVGWPSLRSGSTFSYIVICFIYDIFRPGQSESVDHIWKVAGHFHILWYISYLIYFDQARVSWLTISEKWQDICGSTNPPPP